MSVTLIATEPWPRPHPGRRPVLASLAAALLLHAAVFGLTLAFARSRPPVSLEDHAVALIFAPRDTPAPASDSSPAKPVPPAVPEQSSAPPDAIPPAEPPVLDSAPLAAPDLPAEPPAPSPQPPPAQEPATARPPEPLPQPEVRDRPAKPSRPSPRRSAVPAKPAVGSPATEGSKAETLAPGSAAAPARAAAEAPIAADWQQALAAWMAAHKVYPELARRRGEQGNVELRFTADRSGRVLSVSLVRGAGSDLLDSAAVAMVRNATLPPFPASMPQQTASVTVTIHYALTN